MAKILYISDMDITGSGYMNISIPLCLGLVEKGHEIIVLGLAYKNSEHHFPFKLVAMKTFIEVGAAVHNLRLLWKPDLIIAALDIPWHDLILRQVIRDQPAIPYFGIFPVEGDPLCMDWAMILMQMTKQYAISQFGTDECQKQGVMAEHFQVGIDTVAWRPPTPEERKALRDAAGFEEEDRIVLTVADNQERKALGIAFQSIAEARKTIPHLKYALVTRENNTQGFKLRSLASRDDIAIHDILYIFERGMEFKKLWSMYAIADAFFLPSKAEGLGMPLLEAMAVGLPCVATNCSGMSELLSDGRGYLIKPEFVYPDVFGNANRYMIAPWRAAECLELVLNAKHPQMVQDALDYVQARSWQIPVDMIDKAIKDTIK